MCITVARDVSSETCLLIENGSIVAAKMFPAFTTQPFVFKKTMTSVQVNDTVLANLNDISDLLLGCFYNLVIKPPDKL